MKPKRLLTFLFLFSTVAFAGKPNVIVVLVDDMVRSEGRSRRLT